MGIGRGERSKILNEARSVANTNRNPQSFLKIRLVQKEVSHSHKPDDHAYA